MNTRLLVLTTRLHISSLFLSFVILCQILFFRNHNSCLPHLYIVCFTFLSTSSRKCLSAPQSNKILHVRSIGLRVTTSYILLVCIWPIHALLSDAMHRLYMGLPYTTYTGCLIAAFPTLTWCHLSSPSLCGNVVKCRERWGSSGSLAARVSRASWT